MKKQSWSQSAKQGPRLPRPSCFVCDEEILGKGVPLLISQTTYSKTGLPTKIGQLMGDGFMVVVSVEDVLCKRCSALLNHLDKLESDLILVKKALTDYLKVKYQLTDEDLEANIVPQVEEDECHPASSPIGPKKVRRQKQVYEQQPEVVDTEPSKTEDQSLIYEYEGDKMESEDDSGSENGLNGTTKRVNVEIILEDSSSQRRNCAQDKDKVYKCNTCEFETSDQDAYRDHPEECKNFPKCTICGKMFESNKNIQNHIMQAHLSKWTCHFCSITFSEEVEFTSHMKSHFGNNFYPERVKLEVQSDSDNSNNFEPPKNLVGNYECNICEFQNSNKALFDDHIRKHVVLKFFKCKTCGIRFEEKSSLVNHMQSHNRTVKLMCEVCSMEFKTQDELVVHSKTHEEKEISENTRSAALSEWVAVRQQDFLTQSVDNCDFSTSTETEDKSSMETDKSDGTIFQFHTCNACSLTFVNDVLYKQHMRSHIIEKNIVDQDNSLISSLTEPNDYVENVMDDSLEDIFAKMHSQTEARYEAQGKEGLPQKHTFKCDVCCEAFKKLEELQEHKNIHELSPTDPVPDHLVKIDEITIKMEDDNFIMHSNQESSSSSAHREDNSQITILSGNNVIEETAQVNGDSKLKSDDGARDEEDSAYEDSDDDSLENIYKMVYEKKATPGAGNGSNPDDETIEQKDELPSTVATSTDGVSGVRKTYVCAMCGYRTQSMDSLRKHFKQHQEDGMHVCKICNKCLPSGLKLKQHMKSHDPSPPEKMTCPNCFKDFPDKMHLQRHLQESHQRERIVYQCQFCQEQFSSRKAYKTHEETHPERFEFKCDECNATFIKEKQLGDHKDLVHRDPHCRFCGKEILKLKTLRNHELRHLKEKDSYECDICKRVFKTKTGLRHHVAVHTGEYKYCCDYCGRGFMSRMMMEEHRSMHTKEERYVCDVCGRKFSFQSTYWIHRKWHDNPYPYKCSFCGRMFRHSSLLAVHKRKHTGERPYKCPHCPLTFPVGGTLKRHLILHTGVYPFNCESCKRGFTTRHKYATHMAKVHGDFEMLNAKPQQNEYKMVIRENEPQVQQEQTVWQLEEDSDQGEINFKLAVAAAGNDDLEDLETIPCSIVSEDMLTDNMIPTRVVEIVLDEASQAVATVTLADPSSSLLPELWYQ